MQLLQRPQFFAVSQMAANFWMALFFVSYAVLFLNILLHIQQHKGFQPDEQQEEKKPVQTV